MIDMFYIILMIKIFNNIYYVIRNNGLFRVELFYKCIYMYIYSYIEIFLWGLFSRVFWYL